ncbi:hypothetical protein LAV73_15710 [Lysinibacillus xylanilyticus]|nr:hypothetical protein [Lysinibacillus xylanilyticus]
MATERKARATERGHGDGKKSRSDGKKGLSDGKKGRSDGKKGQSDGTKRKSFVAFDFFRAGPEHPLKEVKVSCEYPGILKELNKGC